MAKGAEVITASTSKIKEKSFGITQKELINTAITKISNKKRARKSKDSSTSNSNCDIMSTHSDSDKCEYATDATIEADDFFFCCQLNFKG